MLFRRKNNKQKEIKTFTLSNESVLFIKKYAYPQLNTNSLIDEELLDDIVELATQWELDMIDPLSKDGQDKTFDYPEKERNELADKFVGEITGQWNEESTPDFNDLNKRLGLIG